MNDKEKVAFVNIQNIIDGNFSKDTIWKYEPVKTENIELPAFLGGSVKKDGEIYKFEFLGMEFDSDWQMLTIDGEDIELKKNFSLKNDEARDNFKKVNKSDYKPKKILKSLQKYIREVKTANTVPITELIFKMVEEVETGAKNNDLIQAIKNLLIDAELHETYAGYVMPLKNNVCRPIKEKDIIKFIKDVTGVKAISNKTLKDALDYINDDVKPTFNCIVTANGYYNFNEGKFYKESPEPIVIKKASPYNYREELIGTTPPELLNNFLYETFTDDPSKIPQLLEIFGYMLDDGNMYQILPHFTGKGRNGKGVCLKLLGSLVDGNDSSVDIFSVEFTSKYSAPLITSDINIINEVKSVRNIAEVKEYIGQDGLQLAPIYEQGRKYTDDELPKSILATNNFKNLGEALDYPLIRRLTVFIEFVNVVPPEKQNPNLVNEILAETDSMDWLLTNSIYLYQQIKNKGTNGSFEAEHTFEETNNHLTKYTKPVLYTIKELYAYDYDKWEEIFDNGERDSKWNKFVSLNDVLTDLQEINPETQITLNKKTVKSLIMEAFNLMPWDNSSSDKKDYYYTEQRYNQSNEHKHLIYGLLRK